MVEEEDSEVCSTWGGTRPTSRVVSSLTAMFEGGVEPGWAVAFFVGAAVVVVVAVLEGPEKKKRRRRAAAAAATVGASLGR